MKSHTLEQNITVVVKHERVHFQNNFLLSFYMSGLLFLHDFSSLGTFLCVHIRGQCTLYRDMHITMVIFKNPTSATGLFAMKLHTELACFSNPCLTASNSTYLVQPRMMQSKNHLHQCWGTKNRHRRVSAWREAVAQAILDLNQARPNQVSTVVELTMRKKLQHASSTPAAGVAGFLKAAAIRMHVTVTYLLNSSAHIFSINNHL